MPLHPRTPWSLSIIKTQNGFTFLVLVYSGCLGKQTIKWVLICFFWLISCCFHCQFLLVDFDCIQLLRYLLTINSSFLQVILTFIAFVIVNLNGAVHKRCPQNFGVPPPSQCQPVPTFAQPLLLWTSTLCHTSTVSLSSDTSICNQYSLPVWECQGGSLKKFKLGIFFHYSNIHQSFLVMTKCQATVNCHQG